MTQPLTGEVRTLSQLADEADLAKKDTFRVFHESDCLMMVISSMKTVGEAVVTVPASGQHLNPKGTVSKHPRHHVTVQQLIELLSPEQAARPSITNQSMKMRISNPRYMTNPQLRDVQAERVTGVARCVARLTGKSIKVRFQESDGHNALYLDGVVEPT